MLKHILLTSLYLVSAAATAAELTALEQRWLRAAAPVLAYSQQIKLPIDIIVQPTPRAGDVPLAIGFDGGRCKLVLSLRANPEAEAVLQGVPEPAHGELIEAMAAHEVAHCWRHVAGGWNVLPAGFVETGDESAADSDLLAAAKALRAMRREEGFADLAALAWVRRSRPQDYRRIHAWLAALRRQDTVPGSGHDTHAWVRLAADGARFGDAAAPFEAALPLWQEGLLRDE
ncbi:MAG TPA: hypothetical protein VF861_05635 [Telluria sp.]